MNFISQNNPLNDLIQKVESEQRLTREDGIRLMQSSDILTLGYLADIVRKRTVGDYAYFSSNININPTNICGARCPLCAFSRDTTDSDAYTLTLDEIEKKIRAVAELGLVEIHIVGGMHPSLPLSFYEEMLQRIKQINPQFCIQAFTAVELDHFAELANIEVSEVLIRLKQAGLDTIPGGGAEIFSPRVRQQICPKKISGSRWLEIHQIAHQLGIKTNATMLYGHMETLEERVDHLLALRELQDKTGGFQCFVPLAFHPKYTRLSGVTGTTGYDDLKVIAVSRILLDNFNHIKALWMYLGPKMAQTALCFGADDLGGTSVEEKIVHAAGAEVQEYLDKPALIKLIHEAGRVAVETDSRYLN
ncbi:MAG: aminofutalosine synthase MqnE [bacterium]|nr:aminofutalosine synthase MqnE [bacterium]